HARLPTGSIPPAARPGSQRSGEPGPGHTRGIQDWRSRRLPSNPPPPPPPPIGGRHDSARGPFLRNIQQLTSFTVTTESYPYVQTHVQDYHHIADAVAHFFAYLAIRRTCPNISLRSIKIVFNDRFDYLASTLRPATVWNVNNLSSLIGQTKDWIHIPGKTFSWTFLRRGWRFLSLFNRE
ncbi:hypothetical protein HKX48_001801, partial [Thoreauomyces humboldtii]